MQNRQIVILMNATLSDFGLILAFYAGLVAEYIIRSVLRNTSEDCWIFTYII